MRVVKLAVSKTRTYDEIANKFNIKLHAVSDLVSNMKKRPSCFIKKREKELKKIISQVAIAGTLKV